MTRAFTAFLGLKTFTERVQANDATTPTSSVGSEMQRRVADFSAGELQRPRWVALNVSDISSLYSLKHIH